MHLMQLAILQHVLSGDNMLYGAIFFLLLTAAYIALLSIACGAVVVFVDLGNFHGFLTIYLVENKYERCIIIFFFHKKYLYKTTVTTTMQLHSMTTTLLVLNTLMLIDAHYSGKQNNDEKELTDGTAATTFQSMDNDNGFSFDEPNLARTL
ncbi:hypothetical protein BDA99DRAFT_537543 [Phascolomyces articulosus]|uniref:Uncharacterized protein n=1 Tax=Phascolomyces articulosus TaxID=60185 RepID=A0AAD5JZQ8_9FUNG|nr:hypothetical protein BDA99DRAFT_537543 [Phascolomyces articulosus]